MSDPILHPDDGLPPPTLKDFFDMRFWLGALAAAMIFGLPMLYQIHQIDKRLRYVGDCSQTTLDEVRTTANRIDDKLDKLAPY